jgi:hypothetical protein
VSERAGDLQRGPTIVGHKLQPVIPAGLVQKMKYIKKSHRIFCRHFCVPEQSPSTCFPALFKYIRGVLNKMPKCRAYQIKNVKFGAPQAQCFFASAREDEFVTTRGKSDRKAIAGWFPAGNKPRRGRTADWRYPRIG